MDIGEDDMMMIHPQLDDICLLAKQAGLILSMGFERPHEIREKGFQDVVTEIDRKSEQFILAQIMANYPGHAVLTEESGFHGTDSEAPEHVWYIDPLDGTMNFAHNLPYFCVSIGYAYQDELLMGAIYDPLLRECWYAEKGKGAFCNGVRIQAGLQENPKNALLATGFNMKHVELGRDNFPIFQRFMQETSGVRRMGSAALEIAYVASGRLDGMWELHLSAWDVAAGFVIAREAGVTVSDFLGDPDCFRKPYEFVMANPKLHAWMLNELQSFDLPRSEPS